MPLGGRFLRCIADPNHTPATYNPPRRCPFFTLSSLRQAKGFAVGFRSSMRSSTRRKSEGSQSYHSQPIVQAVHEQTCCIRDRFRCGASDRSTEFGCRGRGLLSPGEQSWSRLRTPTSIHSDGFLSATSPWSANNFRLANRRVRQALDQNAFRRLPQDKPRKPASRQETTLQRTAHSQNEIDRIGIGRSLRRIDQPC